MKRSVLWIEGPAGPTMGIDVERIAAAGGVVRCLDCPTADARMDAVASASVLILGEGPVTRDLIEAAPSLLGMVRCGVGYDNIDLDAASDAGILVANVPGVNAVDVAEHAITLMLAVSRCIPLVDRAVRKGLWRDIYPAVYPRYRVTGRTLGLVGYGTIGRAVGARALGLGLKVLAADPYTSDEVMRADGVEPCDFPTLLAASDFVSLHVPLTDETESLFNRETLARMKKGSILINTSRGPVVSNDALYEALESGHLFGAGLDVFEQEPPDVSHPLFRHDRVIVTPHYSSLSVESQTLVRQRVADQVIQLLQGIVPDHVVNVTAIDRSRLKRVSNS